MCYKIIFGAVIFSLLRQTQSAKILCVFPFPALSHQIVYQPIWRELYLRGHELTVITTHPIHDRNLSNLHEIDVNFLEDLIKNKHNFARLISTESDLNKLLKRFLEVSNNLTEEFFKHAHVQNLIRSNRQFDIIIGELVFPAWFAFSEVFKCPLILMNSMPTSLVGHDSVGNPTHPVLHADFNLPFGPKLNFFERLISVCYSLYMRAVMHWQYYPEQTAIARRYLGENISGVMDLQNKVDLIFTHIIPGFHPPRPFVPSYVELSGLHMESSRDLPKIINDHLNTAKNGAIYMSFGTNINGFHLEDNTINIFIKVFANLPYKILWKFEEQLPNLPPNVMICEWCPQQDILRHPSIKLFVTHGGQQSISEAIYNKVPLIGIPFFGDQFYNVLRFRPLGIGVSLDKASLNEKSFKSAIMEVILNPIYRLKLKKLADIAIDQPIKPLEKAIWWIEYVIRHKGAKHLRSAAVDMPFYQYFLLDILALLILLTLLVLYFLKMLLTLCRYVFNMYFTSYNKPATKIKYG